jgi:hypothetical protein
MSSGDTGRADTTGLPGDAVSQASELSPLARRIGALDPNGVLRIRLDNEAIVGYARLPFDVLVGRTVRAARAGPLIDCTVYARDLVGWLDGTMSEPPPRRDGEWRGTLPPTQGWRRVERIPERAIRAVVRNGAASLREAAERGGAQGGRHGAQFRSDVADAVLDSIVLTATDGALHAEVTLRAISALTRMGFLPRDSHMAVDVCGRWSRLAAEYGSVYAERPDAALGIVS